MDLKEAEILGDSLDQHWYYVSKGRVLTELLRGQHFDSVMDVGAGSGIFSRLLLEHGICDQAVCVDSQYVEDRDEVFEDRPLLKRRTLPDSTGSALLMMDVLEHVADDMALLRQYADPLPRGASVVVTVPAFQFLWSGHDVFLEHYRRYRLSQVEEMLRGAGLEVVTGRYFFAVLFPVAAAMRLFHRLRQAICRHPPRSSLRPAPDVLNRLMVALHDLERRSLFRVNRIAGLSVVILAKKS